MSIKALKTKAAPLLDNGFNHTVQPKDTAHLTQLKTIFCFLQNHVATASMVSDATGVPQKNICRYKRDLENAGLLWEVEKKLCLKTGFRACYLTVDPAKAPKKESLQFKLLGRVMK
jgi:hypothetical protein